VAFEEAAFVEQVDTLLEQLLDTSRGHGIGAAPE